MTTILFVVPDALQSTLKAAGAPALAADIPVCALHVGDVIAYPGPIALAVRVAERSFWPADESRPARWYVVLEATENPLSLPAA